jgi:hypothetical protein
MNAATWNVTVSLSEEDGHVYANAVLRAGGKVFEGSGTASSNPSDVVRPAPGAAHATERALLDLVDSIRCARLQRFAVGGFGPLLLDTSLTKSTADNTSTNGARATHTGAARDQNGLLAELSRT